MSPREAPRVLTINAGSSSLKAAVYRMDHSETRLLRLEATRIGGDGSSLLVIGSDGRRLFEGAQSFPDYAGALDAVVHWMGRSDPPLAADIVAHRVVHGGERYWEPTRVTPELLAALEGLLSVDPDHMPQALECIRTMGKALPGLPQVACFDTGFHHAMPAVARTYAFPQQLTQAGIVRYGFHGLSYEYVVQRLRQIGEPAVAGRVIVAHLGSGASLAALHDGRSVDTSMGFSPTGGLVMGTRCGDIDPAVVVYLLRQRRLTPDQVSDLLSRRSGLLGVSGTSQDMRDLLEREPTDPRAAQAIELFCYQATKYVAAYAGALGGLDLLVFTAGIGEHSPPIRSRICDRLGFLGLELDPARNGCNERLISTDRSRVRARIIKTNEELMIARHATRFAP